MTTRSEPDQMSFADRLEVIEALMLRDLMARFGRNSLGFVWVVLEPMILTAGVMIIWSLIYSRVYHGVPVVAFVLTCYMPLTLWRHCFNSLIRILSNNVSLLQHRVIHHSDIIIARLVIEFLSTSTALSVVYFVMISFGIADGVADPALMLAGWIYTGWLFGSLGIAQAIIIEKWHLGEKFVAPIQYLALPLSGVFFMVDWLPGYAQKLLLLNPMVHCFEMFRAGYFGPGIRFHYSVIYLTSWCLFSSVLAVALLWRSKNSVYS